MFLVGIVARLVTRDRASDTCRSRAVGFSFGAEHSWTGSGQQIQPVDPRLHDGEVASIDRCDVADTESLGGSDHRCVDGSEGQISVLRHEFSDAHPVRRRDWFDDEIAGGEVSEKPDLGLDPEARPEQVDDLGDHQGRNDQRPRVGFEQVETRVVVTVVAVDVGVQRPGIDDQRDEPTSLARISSMRSEMSERPLAPAPAARNRRLPCGAARSVSIASLVSADTVTPRLSASCRSRASRSSGSLTVVRCMYASIPHRCGELQRFAAHLAERGGAEAERVVRPRAHGIVE